MTTPRREAPRIAALYPTAVRAFKRRLVVADGLIREREAYYDSLALMIALLGRPSSWYGYWRYRGYLPG